MSEPLTAEAIAIARHCSETADCETCTSPAALGADATPWRCALDTGAVLATIDDLTARLAVKERACARLAAGGPHECRMSCRRVERESCSVLLRFGMNNREECIARRIAWAEEEK